MTRISDVLDRTLTDSPIPLALLRLEENPALESHFGSVMPALVHVDRQDWRWADHPEARDRLLLVLQRAARLAADSPRRYEDLVDLDVPALVAALHDEPPSSPPTASAHEVRDEPVRET